MRLLSLANFSPKPLRQRAASILSRLSSRELAKEVRAFLEKALDGFPWPVEITDWEGNHYFLGGNENHWCGRPLIVKMLTPEAGRDLLGLNGLRFLERFLVAEVELEGNLYILSDIRSKSKMHLNAIQLLTRLFQDKAFQGIQQARVNVKSHYDIPQEVLNIYLDQIYMSYSTGIFADPEEIHVEDLIRVGQGEADQFDSLEQAQWRKFKDAVDFIAPKEGETLLDIGCGYGGQLVVALENYPFGKVVGFTHSANQVREGKKLLAAFDKDRWELNEGDYREDNRIYDHVTSTGMVSHVGPRGFVPYLKNVRKRIKKGGRYLHHAIMTPYSLIPLDFQVGPTFNKKYVWPGFHWFTLGEHVRALEKHGFEVTKLVNLSPSYAKTTAAWYERLMAKKEIMIQHLERETFRAWQIFLAGFSGNCSNKGIHVYRIYCEAV